MEDVLAQAQHVIRCDLQALGDAPVESPAVIVIGPVAALELTDITSIAATATA